MNKKLLIFFFAAMMLLNGVNLAQAQNAKIEKKLKDDVEIMETVLDKMFASETSFFTSFASNSRGFYLKDYGVIFHVRHSLPINEMQFFMMKNLRQQVQAYTVKEKNEQRKDSETDFAEQIEEIKQRVVNFLGNYASNLRDLKANERVAVVVDIGSSVPGMTIISRNLPQQIVASAPVKDLRAYRQEKISEAAFRKKIQFDEIKMPAEDISIFTNVVRTAMEHAGRQGAFNISSEVQGIRFPGYGVLFLTSVDFSNPYQETIQLQKLLEQQSGNLNVTIKQSKTPDYQKQVDAMQQKLIDLLSNYGHTLRNLQPNDWVEFAINFRGGFSEPGFSRGIIKVRKKTIDDFNRNKITFKQFKKQVAVVYY
ncbi:MAG: hypothetical protein GXO74_05310 [Calditrichaeota bacterium]|nr:hypothetical protein [Calditrichota bacterium]